MAISSGVARLTGSRVLGLWTRVMLDELAAQWRAPGWLEAHGLVEPATLRGNDPMIPHEDMIRIWGVVTDDHRDPWFGIRFCERHAERAVGILSYASAHAANLEAATHSLLRMQRLADTHNEVVLRTHGECVVLEGAPSPGVGPWPRHLAESIVAGYLQLARAFTGRRICARGVKFQHRGDPSIAEWFGGDVTFEAPANELWIDRAELLAPVRTADPTLFEVLHAAALRAVEAVAPATGIEAEVLRALRTLPAAQRRVDDVAVLLGQSTRSLQRRLRAAGASFRVLVANVRSEQLAAASLEAGGQKDAAIAEVLGYRDASSVRRLRRKRAGRAGRA